MINQSQLLNPINRSTQSTHLLSSIVSPKWLLMKAKKVVDVSSESLPAWWMGPRRATRRLSASVFRPPCMPSTEDIMNYAEGERERGSEGAREESS